MSSGENMRCPSCSSDNIDYCDYCDEDLPLIICLNCQYVWDEQAGIDSEDVAQHQVWELEE